MIRRRRDSEKHVAFFKLIENLSCGECPACLRARCCEARYLDSLLYENVNNREFRAELRAADGFCWTHAHQLAGRRDGLAVAVLHLEFIERALADLSDPRSKAPSDRRRLFGRAADARPRTKPQKSAVASRSSCPVCSAVAREIASTLDIIVHYAEDEQFSTAFRGSVGLCLPHFDLLTTRTHSVPPIILEQQQNRLQELVERTRSFIDAENAATTGARPTISREERLVWKQLVNHYYGSHDPS